MTVAQRPRPFSALRLSLVTCLGWAALLLGCEASRASPWEPVGTGQPLRDAVAVAARESDGAAAVATPRGVWIFSPNRAPVRLTPRGEVRDLAFDDAGVLWAATDVGLLRRAPGGRTFSRVPLGGGGARRVARIATSGTRLAVASEAGVFLRPSTTAACTPTGAPTWIQPSFVPHRPATAVLYSTPESHDEPPAVLWAAVEGGLYRIALDGGGSSLGAESVALPRLGERAAIQDLARAPSGLAVLTRHSLFLRSAEDWAERALGLPPGAVPARVLFAGERYWLSSDRGLVSSPRAGGPFAPEGGELGRNAVAATASGAGWLFAAGERGVARRPLSEALAPSQERARRHEPALPKPVAARELPVEAVPSVVEVQRRALRYLDLDGRRMARLWRGVRRRGWLPTVELRGGRGRDALLQRRSDQVFSSGATRQLYDETRDGQRSLDVDVVLRWDLGDVAYHPETIDVSKEAREVVELRDEVLDEVTQLYFDRQRVRLSLATANPEDAALLRLRLRELSAGLDSWTGGWWSDALRAVH
jgi:hypothetical protein